MGVRPLAEGVLRKALVRSWEGDFGVCRRAPRPFYGSGLAIFFAGVTAVKQFC